MEDIFYEISSSVPKALPAFVREQYDADCCKLLELIEEHWKNAELSLMLNYVDKYLQFAVGGNCQPSMQLVEALIPITKKLWFISMYNTISQNEKFNKLYPNEPDLEVVGLFQNALTLKLRVRSCRLLNTILESCTELLPSIWQRNCRERSELFSEKLEFARIEVLLSVFEEYFSLSYTTRIAVSYSKRRSWITCVVRLCSLLRRFWLFRSDLGDYLIFYLFSNGGKTEGWEQLNTDVEAGAGSCEVFYKFRILLLLCPNSTLHTHLINGNLFRWWQLVDGEEVSSWNPMFFTFMFRAAKFGWATGRCVCKHFEDRIPVFFNILHNAFGLPNKTKVTKYKETMPGEYTCLLARSLKLYKKVAKLLVLLMHTNADKGPENGRTDIFGYVKSLINTVFPYTHPSNNGKWAVNISLFAKYLVLAHSRKIVRERTPATGVHGQAAMCLGAADEAAAAEFDRQLCDTVFAVSLQGMFSKNPQICNNYEETLKRICHICPREFLTQTVEKLMDSCVIVNEPNQVLGSLRLFTHLAPLIVKLAPHLVGELLRMLLQFISLSEPFITTHSLVLISLLLAQQHSGHTPHSAGTDHAERGGACWKCFGDAHLFKCSIAKPVEEETIREQLSTGEFNYMDLVMFRDAQCRCRGTPSELLARADEALEEGQRTLREAINDWSVEFVAVVLDVCSKSSKVNLKGTSLMNTVEVSTFILMRSCLLNLLGNVSEDTLGVIINKTVSFMNDYAYKLDIVKYAASILSCLSHANARLLLAKTFDVIEHNIQKCFENERRLGRGHNGTAKKNEDDNRLVWYLNCLINVVRFGNAHNLKYLDRIKKIVAAGVEYNSKGIFKLVAKLMQRVNFSLYHVYALAPNSGDAARYAEHDCELRALNRTIQVHWHVPTPEEAHAYEELVATMVNHIDRLATPFVGGREPADAALKREEVDVHQPAGARTGHPGASGDDITLFNRISKILTMAKYLVKSIMLVDTPNRANRELMRETEAHIMAVVMRIHEHLEGAEGTEDLINEKLTKFLNFLVSKDFYSNEVGGNNLDLLFNAFKKKIGVTTPITATKPMIKYLSFHYGISASAYYQDANDTQLATMVQDHYADLLNLYKLHARTLDRARRQAADGAPEAQQRDDKLLGALVKLSLNKYKNVSSNAILILKNMILIYGNIKYHVVSKMLDALLSMINREQTGAPDDAEDNLLEKVLENAIAFFDTGIISYLTVNVTLLEKFLEFMMKVISLSENKDLLMNKYDVLFIQYLNLRERPAKRLNRWYRRESGEGAELDDGAPGRAWKRMTRMLAGLEGLVINHWRSRLYYCSLLLVYNKFARTEQFFSAFFLSMCQYSTNHYVLSLSLQGLYLVIQALNERGGEAPELTDDKTARRVFGTFVHSNHENAVNTQMQSHHTGTSAGGQAAATMGYTIIMNIIKFDKTWPRNRVGNVSGLISRHNFNLSYEYAKLIVTQRGTRGLEPVLELLTELSATPQSYPENHISFAEIAGGIVKHSLELDEAANAELWSRLHPILRNELNNVVYERILDHMDIVRLVLQDEDAPGAQARARQPKYALNLLLNYQANPCGYEHENADRGATGHNLMAIKQLKLFQAAMAEYKAELFGRIEGQPGAPLGARGRRVLNVLLENLSNNAQKIREEVAHILAFMLATAREDVAGAIREFVAAHAPEAPGPACNGLNGAAHVNGAAPDAQSSDNAVLGMLNLVETMYNGSVPSGRGQDASAHLELGLSHLSSQTVNVAELANKCLHSLVSHYHEYDYARVHSLFQVLLRSTKAQNNKIKLISIQLTDVSATQASDPVQKLLHVRQTPGRHQGAAQQPRQAAGGHHDPRGLEEQPRDNSDHDRRLHGDHRALRRPHQRVPPQRDQPEGRARQRRGRERQQGAAGRHIRPHRADLDRAVPHSDLAPERARAAGEWPRPHVHNTQARCGGAKYPLDVRNVVEKTLQEFFKSHTDAWAQIHASKFTEQQLELLNTYKGSPLYFN